MCQHTRGGQRHPTRVVYGEELLSGAKTIFDTDVCLVISIKKIAVIDKNDMNMPVKGNTQTILHKDIVLETVQQALTLLTFRVFFS